MAQPNNQQVQKAGQSAKGDNVAEVAESALVAQRQGDSFVVLHELIQDHTGAAWRRGRVIGMPANSDVTLRLLSLDAIRPATAEEATHNEVTLTEQLEPSYEDEIASLNAKLAMAESRNLELANQLARKG